MTSSRTSFSRNLQELQNEYEAHRFLRVSNSEHYDFTKIFFFGCRVLVLFLGTFFLLFMIKPNTAAASANPI